MKRCAWPKPACDKPPTVTLQMLEYCGGHAVDVYNNRQESLRKEGKIK